MIRNAPLAAVVAVVALACTSAAPDPVLDGLAFPRHGWISGGPAAMGSGTLVIDRGCLFMAAAGAPTYLVVWPPAARLASVDGAPAVMIGDRTVALGEELRMGGGFYSDIAWVAERVQEGILPPACLTPEIFLSTGFVER